MARAPVPPAPPAPEAPKPRVEAATKAGAKRIRGGVAREDGRPALRKLARNEILQLLELVTTRDAEGQALLREIHERLEDLRRVARMRDL